MENLSATMSFPIRLQNFFTEEQYENIDAMLRLNIGMGIEQLGRMKPSYLTEMYRNELMKQWLAYNEERSMETFFEMIASQNDIPVYGLDNTGETMYMIFDREPLHWQCQELVKIIDKVSVILSQRKEYFHGTGAIIRNKEELP